MQYKKKIDSNKGGEPFIVLVESDGNENFTTSVNSSEVIQAITENKLVMYKIVNNSTGESTFSCNVRTAKLNSELIIQVNIVSCTIHILYHTGTILEMM